MNKNPSLSKKKQVATLPPYSLLGYEDRIVAALV
jgi:hypothetical protein